MNNRDVAYDIARACKMPIDEARKVLSVVLETLVKHLRKDKKLAVRDFGRFYIFTQKRVHLPDGSFVKQTKYKCRFSARGKLARILYSRHMYVYAYILAHKYIRQKKEGDKKGAKKTKKMLRKYLIGKRRMAEWLAERGKLPYPLPEIESETPNDRENEE